jgi:hypothetical protein
MVHLFLKQKGLSPKALLAAAFYRTTNFPGFLRPQE